MKQKAIPIAVGAAVLALVALFALFYTQTNKPADAGYTISPPATDGDSHSLKRANYLKNHPGGAATN